MCKHDKFDVHTQESLETRLVSVDVSYSIQLLQLVTLIVNTRAER